MASVETLSHQRIGVWERKMPRSLRSVRIQQSSVEAMARALYSNSMDDLEIVGCFLAD